MSKVVDGIVKDLKNIPESMVFSLLAANSGGRKIKSINGRNFEQKCKFLKEI